MRHLKREPKTSIIIVFFLIMSILLTDQTGHTQLSPLTFVNLTAVNGSGFMGSINLMYTFYDSTTVYTQSDVSTWLFVACSVASLLVSAAGLVYFIYNKRVKAATEDVKRVTSMKLSAADSGSDQVGADTPFWMFLHGTPGQAFGCWFYTGDRSYHTSHPTEHVTAQEEGNQAFYMCPYTCRRYSSQKKNKIGPVMYSIVVLCMIGCASAQSYTAGESTVPLLYRTERYSYMPNITAANITHIIMNFSIDPKMLQQAAAYQRQLNKEYGMVLPVTGIQLGKLITVNHTTSTASCRHSQLKDSFRWENLLDYGFVVNNSLQVRTCVPAMNHCWNFLKCGIVITRIIDCNGQRMAFARKYCWGSSYWDRGLYTGYINNVVQNTEVRLAGRENMTEDDRISLAPETLIVHNDLNWTAVWLENSTMRDTGYRIGVLEVDHQNGTAQIRNEHLLNLAYVDYPTIVNSTEDCFNTICYENHDGILFRRQSLSRESETNPLDAFVVTSSNSTEASTTAPPPLLGRKKRSFCIGIPIFFFSVQKCWGNDGGGIAKETVDAIKKSIDLVSENTHKMIDKTVESVQKLAEHTKRMEQDLLQGITENNMKLTAAIEDQAARNNINNMEQAMLNSLINAAILVSSNRMAGQEYTRLLFQIQERYLKLSTAMSSNDQKSILDVAQEYLKDVFYYTSKGINPESTLSYKDGAFVATVILPRKTEAGIISVYNSDGMSLRYGTRCFKTNAGISILRNVQNRTITTAASGEAEISRFFSSIEYSNAVQKGPIYNESDFILSQVRSYNCTEADSMTEMHTHSHLVPKGKTVVTLNPPEISCPNTNGTLAYEPGVYILRSECSVKDEVISISRDFNYESGIGISPKIRFNLNTWTYTPHFVNLNLTVPVVSEQFYSEFQRQTQQLREDNRQMRREEQESINNIKYGSQSSETAIIITASVLGSFLLISLVWNAANSYLNAKLGTVMGQGTLNALNQIKLLGASGNASSSYSPRVPYHPFAAKAVEPGNFKCIVTIRGKYGLSPSGLPGELIKEVRSGKYLGEEILYFFVWEEQSKSMMSAECEKPSFEGCNAKLRAYCANYWKEHCVFTCCEVGNGPRNGDVIVLPIVNFPRIVENNSGKFLSKKSMLQVVVYIHDTISKLLQHHQDRQETEEIILKRAKTEMCIGCKISEEEFDRKNIGVKRDFLLYKTSTAYSVLCGIELRFKSENTVSACGSEFSLILHKYRHLLSPVKHLPLVDPVLRKSVHSAQDNDTERWAEYCISGYKKEYERQKKKFLENEELKRESFMMEPPLEDDEEIVTRTIECLVSIFWGRDCLFSKRHSSEVVDSYTIKFRSQRPSSAKGISSRFVSSMASLSQRIAGKRSNRVEPEEVGMEEKRSKKGTYTSRVRFEDEGAGTSKQGNEEVSSETETTDNSMQELAFSRKKHRRTKSDGSEEKKRKKDQKTEVVNLDPRNASEDCEIDFTLKELNDPVVHLANVVPTLIYNKDYINGKFSIEVSLVWFNHLRMPNPSSWNNPIELIKSRCESVLKEISQQGSCDNYEWRSCITVVNSWIDSSGVPRTCTDLHFLHLNYIPLVDSPKPEVTSCCYKIRDSKNKDTLKLDYWICKTGETYFFNIKPIPIELMYPGVNSVKVNLSKASFFFPVLKRKPVRVTITENSDLLHILDSMSGTSSNKYAD